MRNWPSTLTTMQSAGTALTNSVTATSLLRAEAKKRLDPNFFYVTGRKAQVRASGLISTIVTTPGTMTLALRFTGAPDSASPTVVTVATSIAMVLSTTAKTNVPWWLDWELTAFAIGTTANLMHHCIWTSEAAGATTVVGEAKTIVSGGAVGSNFDATQIQLVDLFGTWTGGSNPTATNSIICQQFDINSKN